VFEPIAAETERVATQVMDAAFKVHRALGPGLLESVYEICLCHQPASRTYLSNGN
jgi:GxxExxY protein